MSDRLVIGSDFAGFSLKETIKSHLLSRGYEVDDLGMTDENHPLSYHTAGYRVGRAIQDGLYPRAILVCGSGMGVHIAAGKFPKVFCAVCESVETARRSRVANDCNVLALGAFYTPVPQALEMVDVFLITEFGEGESEEFRDFHRRCINEMLEFQYQ